MKPNSTILALTAFNLMVLPIFAEEPEPEPEQPKQQDKIAITKETTFLLEPLDEDGYVNYLAALNLEASAGVTPENNFIVARVQITGPKEIEEELREDYFKRLGIDPLPEEGDYFQSSDDFLDEAPNSLDEVEEAVANFDQATTLPWSEKKYPLIADWLKTNEKHLDRLVEASRRTKCYHPLLSEDGFVTGIRFFDFSTSPSLARALRCRAMLRIEQGKLDAAWEDLQATHRMARLQAQGPALIDALVAIAVDQLACQGDRQLLLHGKIDKAQLVKYRKQFDNLPPLPSMASKVNHSERFTYLDAVQMVARDGVGVLDELGGGDGGLKLPAGKVDWNETMKMGNESYDKIVAALRNPDHKAAQTAFEEIEKELLEYKKNFSGVGGALKTIFASPKTRGRQIGSIFSALLLPATGTLRRAEIKAQGQLDLTQVTMALKAYHIDHGSFPKQLDDLTPDYLAKLPSDQLAEGPLQYQKTEAGFLLYNVGHNRKDDGGDDELDNVVRYSAR